MCGFCFDFLCLVELFKKSPTLVPDLLDQPSAMTDELQGVGVSQNQDSKVVFLQL